MHLKDILHDQLRKKTSNGSLCHRQATRLRVRQKNALT